jgi:hypothetical protein
VKAAFFAGDSLHNQTRTFVNENAQCYPLPSWIPRKTSRVNCSS